MGTLYIVVETILEVWFEWTVLSSLEALHNDHWVAGIVATSMLFAHWLYFIAGGLGLVFANNKNLSNEEISTSDISHLKHMKQLHSLELIKEEDSELLKQSTDDESEMLEQSSINC